MSGHANFNTIGGYTAPHPQPDPHLPSHLPTT